MVEYLIELYRPATLSTMAFTEKWSLCSPQTAKRYTERRFPGWCVRVSSYEDAVDE